MSKAKINDDVLYVLFSEGRFHCILEPLLCVVARHYFLQWSISTECISVFYYWSRCLPDRKVFLATWKEIPSENEFQTTVPNVSLTSDQAETKLNANNIFTIARRTVDSSGANQDLMYMSSKFINNIWVLAEFKIIAGASSISVRAVFYLMHSMRNTV